MEISGQMALVSGGGSGLGEFEKLCSLSPHLNHPL